MNFIFSNSFLEDESFNSFIFVSLGQIIKVVDCGSINKAAEQLYVSQPSLSRSIHSLEEEMGKELVIRSNRGVTLTPTGRLLYYYGRSILEQFQVLEKLKNLPPKHYKFSKESFRFLFGSGAGIQYEISCNAFYFFSNIFWIFCL